MFIGIKLLFLYQIIINTNLLNFKKINIYLLLNYELL